MPVPALQLPYSSVADAAVHLDRAAAALSDASTEAAHNGDHEAHEKLISLIKMIRERKDDLQRFLRSKL